MKKLAGTIDVKELKTHGAELLFYSNFASFYKCNGNYFRLSSLDTAQELQRVTYEDVEKVAKICEQEQFLK